MGRIINKDMPVTVLKLVHIKVFVIFNSGARQKILETLCSSSVIFRDITKKGNKERQRAWRWDQIASINHNFHQMNI
jgi:hypothetical protein